MTNNEMHTNLIIQMALGMIPEDDEDLIRLDRITTYGDRHAEYQGHRSRWVDLTPEQIQQARDNMIEE